LNFNPKFEAIVEKMGCIHDITEILLESGVKRHQTNKQANQNREQILIIHCIIDNENPNFLRVFLKMRNEVVWLPWEQ
jgi:hypothetical protein